MGFCTVCGAHTEPWRGIHPTTCPAHSLISQEFLDQHNPDPNAAKAECAEAVRRLKCECGVPAGVSHYCHLLNHSWVGKTVHAPLCAYATTNGIFACTCGAATRE